MAKQYLQILLLLAFLPKHRSVLHQANLSVLLVSGINASSFMGTAVRRRVPPHPQHRRRRILYPIASNI